MPGRHALGLALGAALWSAPGSVPAHAADARESAALPTARPEAPTRAGGSAVAARGNARPTVRASVSNRGAERLGGLRVIRLLDIELGERPPLSPRATGPLGGDVIWVWIDAPTPRVALVEVRRFDRPVSRRNLAIKDLDGGVAARLVALVASEMVRAQARASLAPTAPKPTPGPRTRGTADPDSLTAIALAATARALWLPSASSPLLAGSELGLAHRLASTSQQIYFAWLGAPGAEPACRLLEAGAAFDWQLSLGSPDWRLHMGGRVGAAQLWSPAAGGLDAAGADEGWTARAAATVGVGARVEHTSWLVLALSPGALLHTVEATGPAGEPWSVGGFALDVSLGLSTDFGLTLGHEQSAGPAAERGVDSRP